MHDINLLPNIVANHECDAMKKHYKMTIKCFLKSQFGERYHPLKCRVIYHKELPSGNLWDKVAGR